MRHLGQLDGYLSKHYNIACLSSLGQVVEGIEMLFEQGCAQCECEA